MDGALNKKYWQKDSLFKNRAVLTVVVTAPDGQLGAVECKVSASQMVNVGFRRAVAEAAWSELQKNEKDTFGHYTHRASPTKRVISMLVSQMGREKAFATFMEKIKYEIRYD